ncbi:2-succinyl-6-hydroxy-2,4-cyclohexadiene-1-carboxylate synthase [Vibrio agarivorans]|uniref:2-succinyl-6-hydroxy-2, 4-cyclohexadiene-1-carboxylate synthase n=1 Tax=Vibrio agarivorans TaxID=153622 RepID=UPI0025B6131E|nr:2-succinyl-6-hydroxy-2,4-cyclohexadiene-1-carboxylate synthase [Vibrio agarivorans]MDN3662904.1 2-succinyl-6-hydroxy-2,4-cyclohexadiene-1-carboxylate synthase [Vibrio agarivorans]
MLYSRYLSATKNTNRGPLPLLVFLHGFLGSSEDWLESVKSFDEFPRLLIDLPGFGASRHLKSQDMPSCLSAIETTLKKYTTTQTKVVLVGYSMGGRILLQGLAKQVFSHLSVIGCVVEGAHFGLRDQDERAARYTNDERWAQRFEGEPIEQVLNDWYRQGVFSSLNDDQRQTLVKLRSDNLGKSIGAMLRVTSLAHQNYLLPNLRKQSVPIWYLCGEKDDKFKQLAAQSGLPVTIVQGAGHNVHHECPILFSEALRAIVERFSQTDKASNKYSNNH